MEKGKEGKECKHKGINAFGKRCVGYVDYSFGELCVGCHKDLAEKTTGGEIVFTFDLNGNLYPATANNIEKLKQQIKVYEGVK